MIRTLIVEDDPVLAEAHRVFTERVPGFEVVGIAHHGAEALRLVRLHQPDLVLLDFYLPDMTGLDVCRALRAGGSNVDVIAVTSARDLNAVRSAVSLGIVQYLLKPFAFAAFRERLEAYGEFRRRTDAASGTLGQAEVDSVLRALHESGPGPLPKGLSDETLTSIVSRLRSAAQAGQSPPPLACPARPPAATWITSPRSAWSVGNRATVGPSVRRTSTAGPVLPPSPDRQCCRSSAPPSHGPANVVP